MASINKIVEKYDKAARKDKRLIAEAQKDALEIKAKFDDLANTHVAELASSSD